MDVRCADALDLLGSLPDGSVDLLVTDPPYFRVVDEWWDRQWPDEASFLAWLGSVLAECRRVLSDSGSLYLFCWPGLAWEVEGLVRSRFHVLNRITWAKDDPSSAVNYGPGKSGQSDIGALRRWFGASESVLFAEPWEASDQRHQTSEGIRGSVFEPLRAYLDGERERAGATKPECDEALGNQMAGHHFGRSQWALPTAENYDKLRVFLNERVNGQGPVLRREYEDLRSEYEDLRREYEDLRRPFNATPDTQYTDVWAFPVVRPYPGKHPTEKPLAMLRHIVAISSRPGQTVCDPFLGSGTTALAAELEGRVFIGGDIDQRWVDRTNERVSEPRQPELADGW